MLKLRDKIRNHVLWKIGNGMSINAWYDNWSPSGTLCDIVTSREIYDAGLSIESNIADLVIKYEKNWPEGWNCEYPILNQFVMPIIHKEIEDEVIWVDKHGKENLFSVKVVWKDFIDEETEVDWLNTQERIVVWNLDHDMKCVFCNLCMDSIRHLFFTCDFTLKIWKEQCTIYGKKETVDFLKKEVRDGKTLSHCIKEVVQLKISGLAVKESRAVREVEERWNIKIQRRNRIV
ncbi:RNA-directed DNA polymerase, eukaryota, reverse transcriptase zinc-binding domain protein [Tanacetum coccineum]